MKPLNKMIIVSSWSVIGTWAALMLVGLSPTAWQVLTLSGLVSAFLVPWKSLHTSQGAGQQDKRITLDPAALTGVRPLTEPEQRELAWRFRDAQKQLESLRKQLQRGE